MTTHDIAVSDHDCPGIHEPEPSPTRYHNSKISPLGHLYGCGGNHSNSEPCQWELVKTRQELDKEKPLPTVCDHGISLMVHCSKCEKVCNG